MSETLDRAAPGGGLVPSGELASRSRRPAPATQDQGAAPHYPQGFAGITLADILVTAFLRKWLLLGIFLLPVVVGAFAALRAPVRFTAEGVLVVLSGRENAGPQGLSGFGPSIISVETTKLVRSETEILRSDTVVRAAVQAVGVGRLFPDLGEARLLPWPRAAASEEDKLEVAVELFLLGLRMATEPGSNVIRVGFAFTDRRLAAAALTALFTAYYEQRRATFAEAGSRLLTAELTRNADELRRLEAEIQRVKTEYEVLDITQEITLTGARLDGQAQREDRAREQQATAMGQLAAARAQLAAQPQRVFASEDAANFIPNDEARNALGRLLLERQQMVANYQPDYPGIREIDRRIEVARGVVERNARTNLVTRREVRNPALELLAGRVAVLQIETDAWAQQIAELQRQTAALRARRAALLEAERRLRDLQRQRDTLEAVGRQFAAREAGTRLDENASQSQPPAVRTVQAPLVMGNGRSSALIFAAGGVVGGGILASGALLSLSLTRRILATPGEAERALGLPALGVFGALDPAPARLEEMPAFADLGSLLLDVRLGPRRPQILRFLAPAAEEDDGVMARNLALELARGRGYETLLIDLAGDGRSHLAALGARPLEVERIPGHVLTFNTVIPNLWVSYEARSSRLIDPRASRAQVETLVQELREAFDVVLIIGPDAAEETYAASRLGVLVDANVLLVRSERTHAAAARAARDAVAGAGGALLGLVVTGQRRILPPSVAALL